MAEPEHTELVIIKRHGAHEDAHHGGAWKIAFADFMTAMMALFLVLWLISSTSEKTKHAVAQYFNPVKLVDVTTLKKGFRDPKKTELGAGPKHTETREDADTNQDLAETRDVVERPGAKTRAMSDAAMFKDPYAALAEIAANAVEDAPHAAAVEQNPLNGVSTDASDAFLDPFTTIPHVAKSTAPRSATANQGPVDGTSSAVGGDPASETKRPEAPGGKAASARPMQNKAQAAPEPMKGADQDAVRLKAEIDKKLGSEAPKAAPKVEVTATPEGLLISLTDDRSFSMFQVGSAVPNPETVKIMSVIGAMLKAERGQIVIRGHTDGRPFKSQDYDNWRLSSARAQIAHYMLVRGGLDDKRLDRIEGYADRRLKAPEDPLAAVNRRIEVLLRKEKP